MAAQMRSFLDRTGGLWAKGSLIGKVGSVFTSNGTRQGGREPSVLSLHSTLLHHGMLIAGVPGDAGVPDEDELERARLHGRHVATLTKRLAA